MRPRYGRRRFGFFPMFFLVALLGITYIVYWLWNQVLVAVAPVKVVTYWQALGLLVLFRILFGGFRFNSPGGRAPFERGHQWREKWHQMTDEERAQFKTEWRRRWGGWKRNHD
ncbi:hypothetical protein [Spirosoma panaciterrae]|uniref:hypothetical protein n=1 Tax=Spirosoma panaciterrae TaxID=496058 RepID=UPI0003A073EA|nr:hypothetical protein [Spirosoma panaciterrae]